MSLPRPRAVVFDLDGTLIESRGDIAAACNHALEACGRRALPIEIVRTYVGDGARMLVARAFSLSPDAPEVDAGLEHFHAYYQANPVKYTHLLSGASEALLALEAAGIAIALATNKPRKTTLLVLDALGLTARFGAIAAGGDGPLKPHPFVVELVLGQLGVASRDAWMVGDGPQDVGAGKAAGTVTIGVLEGFVDPARLREAEPDVLLASLHGLLPLLQSPTADRV
jgi:phosphoglycolate phosphatase